MRKCGFLENKRFGKNTKMVKKIIGIFYLRERTAIVIFAGNPFTHAAFFN
jgi:2-methylisocitrate lyase-like PEP mutase family enzyme